MNILKLCSRVPFPPKDGGTIGVWVLLENLAKLDNNIDILSLNTNKHYIDLSKERDKINNNISILDIPINTDIKFYSALKNLLFSKLPYNSERFYSKEYIKSLIDLLKNNNYDVIQIESPNMGYCIPFIRQYSKAPIIARTANIENEIWKRVANVEKNILKKYYFNILSKRMKNLELDVINKSDVFLAVTQKDADYFLRNIENKNKPYKVVPTGINRSQVFFDFVNHKKIDFFFIGALDWIPNQEGLKWFLDNIWNKFLNYYSDIDFHIAGRYASDKFENYLKQYRNVVFHGEVDDAYKFMREHCIMIVPLLSGSGMRVKIIEAMANANPVISTIIGAEGISAENNSEIIIADSPELFCNKMFDLIQNVSAVNRIAKNAMEFITNNFINEEIASELNNYIREKFNIK